MSYQSPIDIIFDELQTKLEGDVLKVIQGYDITVDKNELLKALNYDRDQYHRGWSDGWVQAKWDILKCKDCKHGTETDYKGVYFCRLGNGTHHQTFYCGNAARKEDAEE